MKEDIKELRRICQLPRREFDTWYGIHVCRKISIYLTVGAIRLGLSADSVTLIFLMTGLLSCIFFMLGAKLGFLLGVIFLQLWYIVDHVDGEIARYRKEVTVTGIYFDKMVHYLVHPLLFFALGWGLYAEGASAATVIIGVLTGISFLLITATEDLKDATILQKALSDKKVITFKEGGAENEARKEGKGKAALGFSIIHRICTFPNDMNIITAAVFIKIFTGSMVLYYLLVIYMILATVVWNGKLYSYVKSKRIDSELKRLTGGYNAQQ